MDTLVQRCPDCECSEGEEHGVGCRVEQCPLCGGRWTTCGCDKTHRLFDILQNLRWTGSTETRGVTASLIRSEDLGDVIHIALDYWHALRQAEETWCRRPHDGSHARLMAAREQFEQVARILGWPLEGIMTVHDAG